MANPSLSSIYYILAASQGHPEAQNFLGFRYYNGEGLRHDVDSALYWLRKAACQGNVKAAGNLGYLLSKAPDVMHDYNEAFIQLSYAAECGLPTSYTPLADLYRRGLGCQTDTISAISLYEKAIKAKIPDAQQRLLAMMGYKWKELSADSALYLGLHYYPSPAPLVGVDLIENAAKKGNIRAIAIMGDAYAKGLGVAYDYQRSLQYFLEAAIKDNPSAQYILAELLDFFPDTLDNNPLYCDLTEEMKSAVYWYERARKNGVTDSEEAYKSLFAH